MPHTDNVPQTAPDASAHPSQTEQDELAINTIRTLSMTASNRRNRPSRDADGHGADGTPALDELPSP